MPRWDVAGPQPTFAMTWYKWPDRLHWEVSGALVGRKEDSLWVATAKGTPISRPSGAPPAVASGDSVLVCSPTRPWVARWYRAPGEFGRSARFSCYVDITTHPVIGDDRIDVVDLDLDVVVTWEGKVQVLDEDEFLEHAVSFGYPEDLQDQALKSCKEVQALLAEWAAPFDGQHLEMFGWDESDVFGSPTD